MSEKPNMPPSYNNRRGRLVNRDAIDELPNFFVDEIVMPGIKSMIQRGLHGIVDGIFGDGYNKHYNGYYNYKYEGTPSYYAGYSKPKHDIIDVTPQSYKISMTGGTKIPCISLAQAEIIKDTMIENLQRDHVISVNTFNSILADQGFIVQRNHTDDDWGWYDIMSCSVHTRSDGRAVLTLPRPEYIK